jgi:LacI family transcriptional regulator, repressor for deo operon, udp, cdd, tsx, nupC, and nupG
MNLHPVTLADIAEAAQVSIGTVSRVLNQREGSIKISKATQERVLEVAKHLGYEPNPFASALKTQRTNVIGVIIRDIGDPFLSLVVRVLQRVANQAGFEILIGHSALDFATAQRQLNIMLTRWFDGLFLLGNVPGDDALLQALEQRKTPFVAVACGARVAAPLVTVNDEKGTELALNYLYSLGHRRIAFLGDIVHVGVHDRLACFQQFIQKRGIWHEEYVYTKVSSRGGAAAHVRRLFDLTTPPTALFCASDLLAQGVFSGVWQRGRLVPVDLSIIGFDDIEEAAELFPPLTTIKQPVEEIAQQALALLRTLMENPEGNARQSRLIIEPELVIRHSCIQL